MEGQRKVKEQGVLINNGEIGITQYVKMIGVKMIVVIDPENSKNSLVIPRLTRDLGEITVY